MPYVHRPIVGDSYEVGNDTKPEWILTTVPANFTLENLVLPSTVKGSIKHVFLDLLIGSIYNSNAGANQTFGVNWILASRHGAGDWYYTVRIPTGSFRMPGSSVIGGIRIYGTYDVAPCFTIGGTTDLKIDAFTSSANNLYLRDIQAVARVIMR
jgi:hypothetical protein